MAVDIERLGAVTVITINRPERRNAFDAPTVAGIGRALVDARQDDAVRAIVLTGAGEKAFCSGIDRKSVV